MWKKESPNLKADSFHQCDTDTSENSSNSSGLITKEAYVFPLVPETGLRKRLWQLILSITEEITTFHHSEELVEMSQ